MEGDIKTLNDENAKLKEYLAAAVARIENQKNNVKELQEIVDQ